MIVREQRAGSHYGSVFGRKPMPMIANNSTKSRIGLQTWNSINTSSNDGYFNLSINIALNCYLYVRALLKNGILCCFG